MIGREQRFHPSYSALEKAYISLLGVPVVGLRIRARNIMNLLPPDLNPTSVLDAGSGPGVITFLLAKKYPEAKILGIDTVPGEIEACRKIAGAAVMQNTDFEVADIRNFSYENRFDLVVCVDILEHIEDDAHALKKLHGTLNPGGVLLLHVPSKYRRYPVFRRSLNLDVPTHVRRGYQLDDILRMARETDFEVLDYGYTYGFLETLANNISYVITKARKKNKEIYAIAFPLLNLISWLGRYSRPRDLGAGIFMICKKRSSYYNTTKEIEDV